ncbi:MAG: hypothetical protein FJ304_20305 [Planctomycetes bacterium]|nr:hypothetical protein [Planctomycetota bacterium]
MPTFAQPPANPGGLPLPRGYQPRTPPPQAQPRPAAPAAPVGGGSGKVMYFQKPADALTATGGPGSSGGLAQVSDPPGTYLVPDVGSPALPPPPPPPRYLPQERPLAAPPAVNVAPTYYQPAPDYTGALLQPGTGKGEIPPSKAFKMPIPEAPGGASVTKLPPRESIFMVYDDAQLERAVMERMIQDRIAQQVKQLHDAREALKLKTDPKEIALQEQVIAGLQKSLDELRAIKNPTDDPSYRFPALPAVNTSGTAYKPKTWAYEPRQVLLEPGYVVHRRLHFEERNGERSGWDLGPLSTLIGASRFCRNALMWPQSLASGCAFGFWSTSAGKCLPGSPSPYYLYPPGLTVSGSIVEAGVLTGGAFIFP